MHRSKVVSPMHFVWATRERLPLITSEIAADLYRCLESEASRAGCEVLAIGGMPDHVHLAVMFPATISYSKFMQQLKGTTSKLMKNLLPPETYFYWQEGYGAFGFSPKEINAVIAYINHQERHHNRNQLWPTLEQTYEDVLPTSEGRLAKPPSE